VIATCDPGGFDGIRADDAGRLWAAATDGVHILTPEGRLLARLRLPEPVSNLAFGGARRNHLFITASTSVYAVRLKVNGARYPR
jgi:gluconolactonase